MHIVVGASVFARVFVARIVDDEIAGQHLFAIFELGVDFDFARVARVRLERVVFLVPKYARLRVSLVNQMLIGPFHHGRLHGHFTFDDHLVVQFEVGLFGLDRQVRLKLTTS